MGRTSSTIFMRRLERKLSSFQYGIDEAEWNSGGFIIFEVSKKLKFRTELSGGPTFAFLTFRLNPRLGVQKRRKPAVGSECAISKTSVCITVQGPIDSQ